MAIKRRTDVKRLKIKRKDKIKKVGPSLLEARYSFAAKEPQHIPLKDLLHLQRGHYGNGYYPTSKAADTPSKLLQARKRTVTNSSTAIQSYCAQCLCAEAGKERETVQACDDLDCPLWVYRMGTDPFYNRRS